MYPYGPFVFASIVVYVFIALYCYFYGKGERDYLNYVYHNGHDISIQEHNRVVLFFSPGVRLLVLPLLWPVSLPIYLLYCAIHPEPK